MENVKIKVNTSVEVTRSRIADLICGGMEGGVYGVPGWARALEYIEPPDDVVATYKMGGGGGLALGGSWDTPGEHGEIYSHIHYPMCPFGGGVVLYDCEVDLDNAHSEDAAFKPVLFDYKKVIEGLQVMANTCPHHFGDWMQENDDAVTGSVFVQCAVFGEVMFG